MRAGWRATGIYRREIRILNSKVLLDLALVVATETASESGRRNSEKHASASSPKDPLRARKSVRKVAKSSNSLRRGSETHKSVSVRKGQSDLDSADSTVVDSLDSSFENDGVDDQADCEGEEGNDREDGSESESALRVKQTF